MIKGGVGGEILQLYQTQNSPNRWSNCDRMLLGEPQAFHAY